MASVERNVYFYNVEMLDADQDWRRADVLQALADLDGDNRLLDLGDDNYAWAQVDRVPSGNQAGRVRFFRDRRSNLPGYAVDFNIDELPIPERAGIVEPTHVVLGGDGLIASEYNHFAPRIPTAFARLLRDKLGLDLRIGTYVQGDILEQLERMEYIQLVEFSIVPTPELEEALRNAGKFGEAAAILTEAEGGRRANLRLSGDKHSQSWTEEARGFLRKMLNLAAKDETKVLRARGLDPVSGEVLSVDLLKERLVRRVDVEKERPRSKVLDTSSAYHHIEDVIAEVRETDLPSAVVMF
jgi:hypothetical protein